MIPKEFEKTNKLLRELNKFEEMIELSILELTDPELADQLEASDHSKDNFLSEPEERLKQQINESFLKEHTELNKSKTYFLGCSKDNYTANYNSRLEAFKSSYIDAEKHNFIVDELEALIYFKTPYFIDNELLKSINYSIERTKEYLINKLEEEEEFEVAFSVDKNGLQILSIKSKQKDLSIKKMDNSKINWSKNSNDTDLVELGKAIFETGYVENISQKKFLELFFNFFNQDIKNPSSTLTKIRNRVNDKLKLIPLLEQKMLKWIEDRPQKDDEY